MIHFASACSMGFLRVTIAIFLCPMFSYLILGLQNLINFPLPTTVGKAPIMIRILCASLFRLRCRKDGCSKCHLYRLHRKGGVTALPSAKCPWFFHLHVPRGCWWIPRYVARTMRAVSPSDILLPGLQDVRDCFPLRLHEGLCEGFHLDVKAAHKTIGSRNLIKDCWVLLYLAQRRIQTNFTFTEFVHSEQIFQLCGCRGLRDYFCGSCIYGFLSGTPLWVTLMISFSYRTESRFFTRHHCYSALQLCLVCLSAGPSYSLEVPSPGLVGHSTLPVDLSIFRKKRLISFTNLSRRLHDPGGLPVLCCTSLSDCFSGFVSFTDHASRGWLHFSLIFIATWRRNTAFSQGLWPSLSRYLDDDLRFTAVPRPRRIFPRSKRPTGFGSRDQSWV